MKRKCIICDQNKGKRSCIQYDKALELDPQYEPAIVNKAMTETLAEGERLDNKVKTVEYYKSLIVNSIKNLSNKSKCFDLSPML